MAPGPEDSDEEDAITDLTGIHCLDHLKYLDLSYNHISILSPLAELNVDDWSFLPGLPNLTELYLACPLVSDLTPLAGLTNLAILGLNGGMGSGISDLSPLANLTNLVVLDVSMAAISNIEPLSGLMNLNGLFLSWNEIVDIEPLVDNKGIGDGDEVNIEYNELNCQDDETLLLIDILEDRGVSLLHDC